MSNDNEARGFRTSSPILRVQCVKRKEEKRQRQSVNSTSGNLNMVPRLLLGSLEKSLICNAK